MASIFFRPPQASGKAQLTFAWKLDVDLELLGKAIRDGRLVHLQLHDIVLQDIEHLKLLGVLKAAWKRRVESIVDSIGHATVAAEDLVKHFDGMTL